MNWSFLRLVLLQIGLSLSATNWIMACVSSVIFVVLVNGSPTYFYKAFRGLRKGCPLSPYLFLLGIEGVGSLMSRYKNIGLSQGVKVTKKI